MKVQVRRRVDEARDVVALELSAVGGELLPPFSAGAHIDVRLPGNLTRQYSQCNSPADRTRYAGSRVARRLESHACGRGGHILEISEPRNHFPLHPAAHSVLLAGGIGITPILYMAERLAHVGASFELHYCVRSDDRVAFRDRLAQPDFPTAFIPMLMRCRGPRVSTCRPFLPIPIRTSMCMSADRVVSSTRSCRRRPH